MRRMVVDHNSNEAKTMAPSLRARPTIGVVSEHIPDVKVIRPKIFPDNRGYFCEAYNMDEWMSELDFDVVFKQDNHSVSHEHVLRGLHAQPGMGKLVTCLVGRIFDVAVDVRKGSATFGQHVTRVLDDVDKEHLWIPDGFLHGFLTLSPVAHVTYKCSATYNAALEYGVYAFDANLDIPWPVDRESVILSERDRKHARFKQV